MLLPKVEERFSAADVVHCEYFRNQKEKKLKWEKIRNSTLKLYLAKLKTMVK